MRSLMRVGFALLVPVGLALFMRAYAGVPSCTSCGGDCVPCCRGTWEEKKTKDTEYDIQCEYACARGRDAWHAPDRECRCHPPCGQVYVKKRLYKSEGEEQIERVPKYEVNMMRDDRCGCSACRTKRHAIFDPLGLFTFFQR